MRKKQIDENGTSAFGRQYRLSLRIALQLYLYEPKVYLLLLLLRQQYNAADFLNEQNAI